MRAKIGQHHHRPGRPTLPLWQLRPPATPAAAAAPRKLRRRRVRGAGHAADDRLRARRHARAWRAIGHAGVIIVRAVATPHAGRTWQRVVVGGDLAGCWRACALRRWRNRLAPWRGRLLLDDVARRRARLGDRARVLGGRRARPPPRRARAARVPPSLSRTGPVRLREGVWFGSCSENAPGCRLERAPARPPVRTTATCRPKCLPSRPAGLFGRRRDGERARQDWPWSWFSAAPGHLAGERRPALRIRDGDPTRSDREPRLQRRHLCLLGSRRPTAAKYGHVRP